MVFTNLVTSLGVLTAFAGGMAAGQTFISSVKLASIALCASGSA